jgi:hypothetical protein
LNYRVVSALAAAPVARQGGILEFIDIVLRKAEARVIIVGDDKLDPRKLRDRATMPDGRRCLPHLQPVRASGGRMKFFIFSAVTH